MKPPVKGMYRRGDTWWLRYTPAPGAKQRRESLKTDNEAAAAAKAVELLHMAPLVQVDEFQEELDRYFSEGVRRLRLSDNTVRMRRPVLLAFAREQGVTKFSQLTEKVVETWVESLRGGGGGEEAIGDETIKSYVGYLRAFCGSLVQVRKLRENPVKIQFGKIVRSYRKDFQSPETIQRLLREAPNDEMRYILYCGYHVGMRKDEIIESAPTWWHVEPPNSERRGYVSVEQTPTYKPKDRDERTVPLTKEFENFLRRYLATLPAGAKWVLQPEKKKGKHRYRWDFRKPFAEFMKEQKVKCTPHDMRRSFVSNKLIENSSLIYKVAKWTGDMVSVVERHYAHLLTDDSDIEAGTQKRTAANAHR